MRIGSSCVALPVGAAVLLAAFQVVSFAQVSSALPETSQPIEASEPETQLLPITELEVEDAANDQGGHMLLRWHVSTDDLRGLLDSYEIERAESRSGPFSAIGTVAGGATQFDDGTVSNRKDYYYRITPISKAGKRGLPSEVAGPVRAKAQWFHTKRVPLLLAAIILGGAIVWFISQARAGRELFIRKIAGLEAVDEAVGRATEMGRKIYYIPGTQDMDNVQTIAGVTILGRVARLTAEYEAALQVPVSRSMVMITSREVVKESYLNAGRPDSYNEDSIFYLTDDQFGYAAGIDGMVVRERPATIFYMGAFYAESLILAETGNSIGAIQIAGTAQPAQLPFFVAACDYTLIGEELFAASAYLSREPRLLGSLKGQDVGKAIVIASLLIGVVWQTLYTGVGMEGLGDFTRFFISE